MLLAMVLLSGCAPHLRKGYWVNNNVGIEQFLIDYSDCKRDIAQNNAYPKLQKDLLQCMELKGYSWETHIGGNLITESTLF